MANEVASYYSTDGGQSWQLYGYYDSLSLWQVARARNLVTAGHCEKAVCSGLTDTGSLGSSASWVTDATHFLVIITADAAKHGGKWTSGVYTLAPASGGCLAWGVPYTTIVGLQLLHSDTANYSQAAYVGAGASIVLDGLICRRNGTAGTGTYGIKLAGSGAGTRYARNCIVEPGFPVGIAHTNGTGAGYADNCTVAGCATSYKRESGTFHVRNCIATRFTTDDYTGAFGASSTNNATDSGVPAGANGVTYQPVFADYANRDYHLTQADAAALAGTNLSAVFTLDVDRQTISTWAIGADAEPGAAASGGGLAVQVSGAMTAGAEASITLGATMDAQAQAAVDAAAAITCGTVAGPQGSLAVSGGSAVVLGAMLAVDAASDCGGETAAICGLAMAATGYSALAGSIPQNAPLPMPYVPPWRVAAVPKASRVAAVPRASRTAAVPASGARVAAVPRASRAASVPKGSRTAAAGVE